MIKIIIDNREYEHDNIYGAGKFLEGYSAGSFAKTMQHLEATYKEQSHQEMSDVLFATEAEEIEMLVNEFNNSTPTQGGPL